ncbi:MAG TPA: CsbD family protein [bacterium]|nr:CsbD family protein [bacterium]
MNENPADKWNKIKGIAKETWRDLTDADFEKADGSMFKLYGVIQVKFGDTKESIKARLKNINKTTN